VRCVPREDEFEINRRSEMKKQAKVKKQMLRQGDVLLVRVPEMPPFNLRPRDDKGDVVLKFGESTGHCHSFRGEEAAKVRLWDAGAERYLQVLERAELRHEEHAPIVVEPGIYHLPEQVAYERGELQRVAD
jgi:hypothetical protein